MSARIIPRRVSFDWSRTPLHRIPGEPTATHVIDVLHLLLPAGERWFVRVFREGLPLVGDPEPPAEGRGFMGQEAIRHDPQLAGRLRHSLAEHERAVRKGLLPPWRELGAAIPRYFRRPYHPSQEGSLSRAVQYLKRSPAARAAS